MNKVKIAVALAVLGGLSACAHQSVETVSNDDAARIDRKLVRNAVTFGPGAEKDAVVPDVSSPCLHAEMVGNKTEGNKIIEKHREWTLSCDVRFLGIPEQRGVSK